MRLCERENDTYATVSMKVLGQEGILGISGRNRIVGCIGQCIDNLLIKPALRKCRILGDLMIGERLPNGTYDGIFGWIQSKKVDLYLRGEPDYLNEPWMAKTTIIKMETVTLMHVIHDRSDGVAYFNLLNNFKLGIGLSAIYMGSFFGVLLLGNLIKRLNHRIRRIHRTQTEARRKIEISKKFVSAVSSFGVKRLSALGIFCLFVNLFIWFNQLFLTNNIKTNKVVVDLSPLVRNEHDIMTTKKVACMLGSGQLANFILSSKTNNILSKLYYEKTKLRPEMVKEREIVQDDRCLLTRNNRALDFRNFNFYAIGESNARNLLLCLPMAWNGKKIYLEKNIYEYNLVNYYTVRKPEIAKMILRHTENGLQEQMYDCIERNAFKAARASEISLYQSAEEYAEDQEGFSNLELANFRYIFFYHVLFNWFTLAAFCVHHLFKFVKMYSIPVRSLLRRWKSQWRI